MPTSQISKHPGGILDLRKTKLTYHSQDRLRAKIQVSKIMNILHDHVVNGTEIAHTRLTTGLALLKKVLPDALPDAVTDNLQSKAIENIARTQLVAMAQEMLRQGQIDASTLTEDSCKIAEDAHVIEHVPATVETSPENNCSDESE